MFDQRGELPLLPFGNPIGFVPASRGGVYIESICFMRQVSGDWIAEVLRKEQATPPLILEAQTEQYQKNISGPVIFACFAVLSILVHSIENFLMG